MGFKDVTTISDINCGIVDELFLREWRNVLDNISDPATDAKAKRKITIEVEVLPSKDRGAAAVTTKARSSLAPVKASEDMVFFELTSKGVVASIKEPEVQLELPEMSNISNFQVAKEH